MYIKVPTHNMKAKNNIETEIACEAETGKHRKLAKSKECKQKFTPQQMCRETINNLSNNNNDKKNSQSKMENDLFGAYLKRRRRSNTCTTAVSPATNIGARAKSENTKRVVHTYIHTYTAVCI